MFLCLPNPLHPPPAAGSGASAHSPSPFAGGETPLGGLAKREGAGWGILGGQGWPEGARPAPTGEPQGCRDQPGCTRAVPDAAGHQLLGIPSSLVPATGTGWEAEPGGTPASPPSTDPPKRRNRPPLRAKSRSHQQWDPPNPAGPSPCQTGGHMGDPLPRAVSCSGMPRLGHLPKQPKIAWPPPPVTGGDLAWLVSGTAWRCQRPVPAPSLALLPSCIRHLI